MVNKFIKMLAAYQMNNQVPPGHPDSWPPFRDEGSDHFGPDKDPSDVSYPDFGQWGMPRDQGDALDELQGTNGFPEDRQNITGGLGGSGWPSKGTPAPLPYVGPPRMDMSVHGLRAFMQNKGAQRNQMPGMGFTNLQGTPVPMANTGSGKGPVTSNSLAANLMASRSAM